MVRQVLRKSLIKRKAIKLILLHVDCRCIQMYVMQVTQAPTSYQPTRITVEPISTYSQHQNQVSNSCSQTQVKILFVYRHHFCFGSKQINLTILNMEVRITFAVQIQLVNVNFKCFSHILHPIISVLGGGAAAEGLPIF